MFDQTPLDGVGDVVETQLGNSLFLNNQLGLLSAEGRVVIEFDIRALRGRSRRVQVAALDLSVIGLATFQEPFPIEVFALSGDGSVEPDDFSPGRFVSVFDALPLAAGANSAQSIDVTEFVRNAVFNRKKFLAFRLRTVSRSSVNFGSLEMGPAPILRLKLR